MKLLSLRDSFVFPEKPQKGGVQGASFIKPPQLAPFNAKEQPFNSISELFTLSLTLLVAAVRQLAWLAMQRRLMVLLTDSDLECQTLQENHLGTGLHVIKLSFIGLGHRARSHSSRAPSRVESGSWTFVRSQRHTLSCLFLLLPLSLLSV